MNGFLCSPVHSRISLLAGSTPNMNMNQPSYPTRHIALVIALAVLLAATPALKPPPVTASPSQADIEKKIDALLARMTLEEKLGQLQQLDGEANGNFRPEHLELVRKG